MKILRTVIPLVLFCLAAPPSWANTELHLQKISEQVYAIVGPLGNRTAGNLGNNATFGLVITGEGAVLIDSGGTYRGAQEIDALIKSVTEQPVVKVINTGGQDHRWLGNSYFSENGASLIASERAVKDQQARTQDQLIMLGTLIGDDALEGTKPMHAETTFTDTLIFTLGDTEFQIMHAGQAHTPGDSFVWLPQHEVMFTGDIVYVERMLGVGTQSNSGSWIKTFEAMAAYQPKHVVPGHGKATDLATARSDSYDYLVFLRQAVGDFMDAGGDIIDIGSIDQSKYHYLLNHDSLAGRNAQQVYTEMEWE